MKVCLRASQWFKIFSRVLRDSTPRFVRRSVGWSVGQSVGHTLLFFYSLTVRLLSKWSGELKHGPCPPTRDWGSRVTGLVIVVDAPLIVWEQSKYKGMMWISATRAKSLSPLVLRERGWNRICIVRNGGGGSHTEDAVGFIPYVWSSETLGHYFYPILRKSILHKSNRFVDDTRLGRERERESERERERERERKRERHLVICNRQMWD